jgi:hypothetical protein
LGLERSEDAVTWNVFRSLQEAGYRQELQYFSHHEHKMDYPRYVANGWQIGSGPVESGCKRVVTQRLKGAGMRWSERGSDAVCHLHALLLSQTGCWDDFWSPSRHL